MDTDKEHNSHKLREKRTFPSVYGTEGLGVVPSSLTIILAMLMLYILPTLIDSRRGHHTAVSIGVVNVVFVGGRWSAASGRWRLR